ncbi:MAG TPA: CidA/LrgA family protein [Candidatus Eisenbergiella stercorigallinarum]|jgi:holin-like protein|uniref:CidA/LrgA family protein n=2 Tax=Lachnospiraceae TaxID=186803 RepID=A0A9D2GI86_9FIRM|nr:CidA/LrgA family protein [Lachnoclostridium sp. An138]OUQ16160.1 CidA/LrgA family protein [Lachnoclostridium sp. An138]HIR98122.1 CidA/LrgA family protein [Candidatus Merdisoma faecalis]HIZ79367.1 CidA/LrgA family protein [Candidatus Lachnoclostridium stercorigallinarum]HJD32238.1 CidA/LrgA family protein [Candidatus Eisenbergiella stercorigallinarum]
MKIIKQFGIIFSLCWIATVIEGLLPIAFPASVIAMLLLLLCLMTGVLKIDHIREKSDFLLANMAFFFIPAGVNVINYLDILKANWLPLLLICVITTVITFAATAYSIRLTIWLLGRRKGADR